MFLPGNNAKVDEAERKKGYKRIERWILEKAPTDIRDDCQVSVQEVACGDPKCSPIDTAITIMFPSGGQGMFGIPSEVKDVSKEDIDHFAPTEDIFKAWHKGEAAEWPPDVEDGGMGLGGDLDSMELPKLRFEIGTKVLCRVGPNPEDWLPGEVIELWYKEPNWPPDSFAPYKIKLENGSNIFAPGDMDQIVKKRDG